MKAFEFTHQEFFASMWEAKVKAFIGSLDYSDGTIWHWKKGEDHKKINKELVPLGYYVKYRYGEDKSISFRLNVIKGEADGWVYKDGKQIESIQITIAYYGPEEAEINRRMMKGEDVNEAEWVGDRIEFLKNRVEKRLAEKSKKNYQNIDTLLIGVRDWFVRRVNTEYHEQRVNVSKCIELVLKGSEFKQVALVDADFVGKGELLIIPNKARHPTSG